MIKVIALALIIALIFPNTVLSISPTNSTNDDIPNWRLVFSDDFNVDAPLGTFSNCIPNIIQTTPSYMVDHFSSNCNGLPTGVREKWWAYPDGWTDRIYGTYYPSKVVSVSNGVLNKRMHSEVIDNQWKHLITTLVPKIPNSPGAQDGMLYGRYAIRFKINNPIIGYKIAWLLWPESNVWPRDGEIDFPEVDAFTNTPQINAHFFAGIHMADAEGNDISGGRYDTTTRPVDGNWHTAITEWTSNYIAFFLDGVEIGRQANTANIPHKPMTWRIQSQGMIWQAIEPTNDAVANIDIDWVKAWELLPGNFNGDGHVNLADYNLLLVGYGTTYHLSDYNQLLANYGK